MDIEALIEALRHALAPKTELPPGREWLTVRAYAERLGLHPDTVRRYVRQGMPALRCGRGYRIRVEAADTWLARGGAIGEATRAARTLQ